MATHYLEPGQGPATIDDPCAICVADGVGHRIVRRSPVTTTTLIQPEYFDTTGRRHVHNYGTRIVQYTCSNGHQWTERWLVQCPACGWTIDQEVAEQMMDRQFQEG